MAHNVWHIKNDGFHIDKIIWLLPCIRHDANEGEPCWIINSSHGPLKAICDRRARAAGAQGKITPYKKEYRR